jgi:hypothetical protein
MNAKQRRFAEESAKQKGYQLLQLAEVGALVAKLDGEKSAALGVEAEDALAEVLDLLERSKVEQPKIWKGEPVTYVDGEGEVRVVTEFRAGSVAARMAELLWKKAGFDVSKTVVEHGEVVITLEFDRDLSDEA